MRICEHEGKAMPMVEKSFLGLGAHGFHRIVYFEWGDPRNQHVLGLLVCDPGRLPLPVLVRAAGRPAADLHLPEWLLQEIVRLGERALRPQQQRWPYRTQIREIGFTPYLWKENEIRDLIWLEDELSGILLDLYARHRPGALESRAANLIYRAQKVA